MARWRVDVTGAMMSLREALEGMSSEAPPAAPPPRLPAQAEHERSLIGGIMLRPSDVGLVLAEGLRPEHITGAPVREVYQAILRLHEAGESITALAVADDLMARGLGSAEVASQLESEAALAVTPVLARVSARALVRRHKADILRRACRRAVTDIERGVDPSEVASALEAGMGGFGRATDSSVPVHDLAVAARHRMLSGDKPGVKTGFVDLDRLTGGLVPGEMTIVAGRPAMGKSALGLQLALNAAVKHGEPALFITLEMTAEQLIERGIGCLVGTPGSDAERRSRIDRWAAEVGASPLFVRECPGARIGEIRSIIRSHVMEYGPGLVVVDYLGLIRGSSNSDSLYVHATEASNGLKAAALQSKCRLVAIAQLNRGVEGRNDKRPVMSDLRDSGSLEQDAALVALIHRPEYYMREDTPDSLKGVADIIIAKNRFGRTGEVRMKWTEACTRFDDLGVGP